MLISRVNDHNIFWGESAHFKVSVSQSRTLRWESTFTCWFYHSTSPFSSFNHVAMLQLHFLWVKSCFKHHFRLQNHVRSIPFFSGCEMPSILEFFEDKTYHHGYHPPTIPYPRNLPPFGQRNEPWFPSLGCFESMACLVRHIPPQKKTVVIHGILK